MISRHLVRTTLCLSVLAVACSGPGSGTDPDAADLMLTNAMVITMNVNRELANAVAIRGDHIRGHEDIETVEFITAQSIIIFGKFPSA